MPNNNMIMPDKYDTKFKQYWGHNKLKPLQKQIIKTMIEEPGDSLVVMRTGFGKSVCYQLPFLLTGKCIIVISPLIALMEDQKQSLIEKNIPVTALNSNMSTDLKEMEKLSIMEGENKIIYMSPEYLVKNHEFIDSLHHDNRLAFIALDEAHCVSSWGHDFRPDYNALSCLKNWFPDLPIMALTATATRKTRDEIIDTLQLDEYYEFVSSFDRPNLYIECKQKTSSMDSDLQPYIDEFGDQYCIVYARTIANVKKVCEHLNNSGIVAKEYHGSMTKNQRTDVQTEFANGDFKWIVATVAFGMGIDQDVTLVLHYGAPGDLEAYYQEIGRAGRTGESSTCAMIYGAGDMVVNRVLLNEVTDKAHKKHRESQIRHMEEFIRTGTCRRKKLLSYFGENVKKLLCGNCDSCLRDQGKSELIVRGIQWPMFMFKCLMVHENIYSGITNIIKIILGNKVKPIEKYHGSLFFGIGKEYCKDPNFWKKVAEVALLNGHIANEMIPSGKGSVMKASTELKEWYKGIKPLITEHKLTGFDYDNYLSIQHLVQCDYEIPSLCMDMDKFIRKHTATLLELSIEDELEMAMF